MIKSHSITLLFHTEVIPLWSSQQSSSQSKIIKRRIVQFHHITIEVVSNFVNYLFFFLGFLQNTSTFPLLWTSKSKEYNPQKKKHNFQLHTLRTKPQKNIINLQKKKHNFKYILKTWNFTWILCFCSYGKCRKGPKKVADRVTRIQIERREEIEGKEIAKRYWQKKRN